MTHQRKESAEPPPAVELTPELLSRIEKGIRAHCERKETVFPDLVASCPYETYLAVIAFTFERIVLHARDGGSFRELIYDRLGCGMDAYVPLYLAGGMVISNEFLLSDAPQENDELRLTNALDQLIREQPMGELRSTLIDLMFRFTELSSFARIAKSIIERQRHEMDTQLRGAT